jgi:ribosomal protein L18
MSLLPNYLINGDSEFLVSSSGAFLIIQYIESTINKNKVAVSVISKKVKSPTINKSAVSNTKNISASKARVATSSKSVAKVNTSRSKKPYISFGT